MKDINTLASDIASVLKNAANGTVAPSIGEQSLLDMAANIGKHTLDAFKHRKPERAPGVIWMSELGKPCVRKLWFARNKSDKAEPMSANMHVKFLYGNMLEELVLFLAETAGHTVEKRQASVEHTVDGWSIRGRIDAVVDGVLVDVKSTSPYGYKDFQNGLVDDVFGYNGQLSGYNGLGAPTYERQGFIAIDKQNGHIGFFETKWEDHSSHASELVKALSHTAAPVREFVPVPDGKSGNEKLPHVCSYCEFKHHCWRDSNGGKGLKGFYYSQGPVWMTKVKREPLVAPIIRETETP